MGTIFFKDNSFIQFYYINFGSKYCFITCDDYTIAFKLISDILLIKF